MNSIATFILTLNIVPLFAGEFTTTSEGADILKGKNDSAEHWRKIR